MTARAAARQVIRAVRSPLADLVTEEGFSSEVEAHALVRLEPTAPLLVVPSMAKPREAGRFRLTTFSEGPCALTPVERSGHSAAVGGKWRGGRRAESTAGGCHLEPTWHRNPQYALVVEPPPFAAADCAASVCLKVVLRRSGSGWATPMRTHTADAMVGFYLLRPPDPSSVSSALCVPLTSRSDMEVVHEACFSAELEVSCTLQLQLQPSTLTTLLLVPATYGAGVTGSFRIELTSDAPVRCVPRGLDEAGAAAPVSVA